jgi:hypothetical protein
VQESFELKMKEDVFTMRCARTSQESLQLDLIKPTNHVVHYFDQNGALRSGRLVRRIEKGEQRGSVVVSDHDGNEFVPSRIRNIE